MDVILYHDKRGAKQWIIAEKGNGVIETLLELGYKEDDFLVIDATNQIDNNIESSFGY